VIYVVQSNSSADGYKVLYAGSNSHDAIMIAKDESWVRIRVFKNGKKVVKPQPTGEQG